MGCPNEPGNASCSYNDNAMDISNPVFFYRAILYNAILDCKRAYGGIRKEESKE
jgi:hypothetical protein